MWAPPGTLQAGAMPAWGCFRVGGLQRNRLLAGEAGPLPRPTSAGCGGWVPALHPRGEWVGGRFRSEAPDGELGALGQQQCPLGPSSRQQARNPQLGTAPEHAPPELRPAAGLELQARCSPGVGVGWAGEGAREGGAAGGAGKGVRALGEGCGGGRAGGSWAGEAGGWRVPGEGEGSAGSRGPPKGDGDRGRGGVEGEGEGFAAGGGCGGGRGGLSGDGGEGSAHVSWQSQH